MIEDSWKLSDSWTLPLPSPHLLQCAVNDVNLFMEIIIIKTHAEVQLSRCTEVPSTYIFGLGGSWMNETPV